MVKTSSKAILKSGLIYLIYFLLAGGFLLMTVGCDDKDKIEEEIPEVSPESPDKFVYVIFPVNALGDHAYNDLVLAGILEAQKKAGF